MFENFHERWEQQGTKEGPLTHIKDIYSIEKLHDHHPLHMDPQRSWNVQFFRSITSDSAVFDPAKVEAHVSIFFRLINEIDRLKFIYSEKATKFCEVFVLLLTGKSQK